MSGLTKANLQIIDAKTRDPAGDPIEVQFNPTALHVSMSNSIDAGKTPGRPAKAYLGTGAATLTLELVFDSADEGTSEAPASVLDKTTPVEQLILPRGPSEKDQAPPMVRFHWGEFIFDGVVQTLSLDLDLFASTGVPLRAKVSLSILEQDARFEFKKLGAGAATGGNAIAPGSGGVGGIGLGASASLGLSAGIGGGVGFSASASASLGVGVQTAVAIQGESAAEFAARVGVDPAAWRGIATGQTTSTLSLSAGVELDFSAGVSAGAGLGASTGVEAGIGTSLTAAFGLAPGARVDATAAATAPGFALSAAGGVAAAVQTVAIVQSASAAASTRRAFGSAAPSGALLLGASPQGSPAIGLASVPSSIALAATSDVSTSAAPPRPDRPEQPRTALTKTGLPSASQQARTRPVPPAPLADPRATSFGYGVPLRPRVGGAADQRTGALRGTIPLRPRPAAGGAPTSSDPSAAPWVSLPPSHRVVAPAVAGATTRSCGCSCSCGCKRSNG